MPFLAKDAMPVRGDAMSRAGEVVSLDTARRRRHYIAIAHASESWADTVASFALSGIELTDDDAERAGRVIAGESTLEQVQAEILQRHGYGAIAEPGA